MVFKVRVTECYYLLGLTSNQTKGTNFQVPYMNLVLHADICVMQ